MITATCFWRHFKTPKRCQIKLVLTKLEYDEWGHKLKYFSDCNPFLGMWLNKTRFFRLGQNGTKSFAPR